MELTGRNVNINKSEDYNNLISSISDVYTKGQVKAARAVNSYLVDTYWQIGQHIIEFEQGGKVKAEYGKALLASLSKDLTLLHGKGFSRSNLVYMRLFYLRYPIGEKPSHQLSWSHYVDMVFYHRILRCFVLIDLKIKEIKHYDISQMNMYLGYFANEENVEGDNPPIGIILTRDKDDLLVEYTTYQMNSQLLVQKYQLYLPNREELKRLIEEELRRAELAGGGDE
ncbi:MAG TPA: PDDEXK nuclease domain-containing protein [Candidatus Wunengus sp. YC60]|uniref:PDDEXK nuclease domain-containing protein n=1 Tax=Candidatus Wunengus sp. YC60 TaxID=3367697 RepID=UPI0040255463